MAEEKFCKGCNQTHRCQEVYEHLSKIECPGVAFKVIVAFLLPIVVFIAFLAVFEWILEDFITSKEVQTWVGFLLAFFVTCVCTLITRVINRGLIKNI